MTTRTLWNQRLGMLMACASPGSALAYHLGQTSFKTCMLHRTTTVAASVDRTPAAPGDENIEERTEAPSLPSGGIRGWLRRAFARFEAWSWQREMREHERYLAQSQNVYDLEARMRDIDRDIFFSRARTLR